MKKIIAIAIFIVIVVALLIISGALYTIDETQQVVITMFGKILKPSSNEERLIAQLVVWTLIIMVGMSIPGTKNTRYILPAAPALAIIASYILVEKPDSAFLKGIRKHLLGSFQALVQE